MKTKTTAATLQLRNPSAGRATLTIEYKDANRAYKRLSTGVTIVSKLWDAKTLTIRAGGSQDPQKDTKLVRRKLAEVNAVIEELERTLKRWPVVSELTAALQAGQAPAPTPAEKPLREIFAHFLQEQTDWQPATRKSFTTLLHNILSYEASIGSTWYLSTLTNADIKAFQHWLLETYDYKNSTASKRTRLLRQFLTEYPAPNVNLANVAALHSILPTAPVYLTIQEIEALKALPLSPTSRLGRVRNLQLLQLFTGLRVSDLMRLEPRHIQPTEITIKEKKTQTKSTETRRIPLLPDARHILALYTDETGNLHLPRISDQKFNEYQKELAQLYLADVVLVRAEKHRSEVRETHYRKANLITSHVNRKTFCTLLLLLGDKSMWR